MNRYIDRPLPLLITSAIFAILLISIIVFFGATQVTRGPIEILLALLLGALLLFFRALSRRPR